MRPRLATAALHARGGRHDPGVNSALRSQEPGQATMPLLHLPLLFMQTWSFPVVIPSLSESSIPVPMATNPVTRQPAFNAISPQQVGWMHPIEPDGQVALHYIRLVIFAQRMHPTNRTLDTHFWGAALEEN
eukprot:3206724-Pleurochrysis_carterae.AAC.2